METYQRASHCGSGIENSFLPQSQKFATLNNNFFSLKFHKTTEDHTRSDDVEAQKENVSGKSPDNEETKAG